MGTESGQKADRRLRISWRAEAAAFPHLMTKRKRKRKRNKKDGTEGLSLIR